MPLCPKCGKSFSSDQALCYHMNKKYKCGTWKCAQCSVVFDTKFALKIHGMSCNDVYTSAHVPSYDILCKLYTKASCVFYETDLHGIIHSVSPSCSHHYGQNPQEFVGKKVSSFVEEIEGDVYHKTNTGEHVHVKCEKIDHNVFIEYII